MIRRTLSIGALGCVLAASPAHAQEPPPSEGDADPPLHDESALAAPETAREAELERRIVELETLVIELRERVQYVEEDQQTLEESVDRGAAQGPHFSGYVDVGAFYVTGDGSGIRPDTAHLVFPEYDGVLPDSWVFMGDPLSTAINARGEPADTGPSRAVTFDSVDSRGGFSFLVNNVSLTMLAPLGDEDLTLNARIDFMPRRRDVSDSDGLFLGDFVEARLAYLEYRTALPDFDVSFAIGKIDSVLGVEYRTQDAPDRLEVTPSLLCRYTCGRPLGARARMRFLEDRSLVLNVAVTNGTHFSELFPFTADVDVNHVVTGAGRLSYELPIGSGIEVGVSGAVGPQDMQTDDSVVQWHVGVDLLADWDDLYFSAEFVQGEAPGASDPGDAQCGLAPCLRYRGAYGRAGYRFIAWFMPYVRVDWREALHQDGASFVYVSELIRVTGGLHFDISPHVLLKAEYTANLELGRIPQFDNDIFTASLVARF